MNFIIYHYIHRWCYQYIHLYIYLFRVSIVFAYVNTRTCCYIWIHTLDMNLGDFICLVFFFVCLFFLVGWLVDLFIYLYFPKTLPLIIRVMLAFIKPLICPGQSCVILHDQAVWLCVGSACVWLCDSSLWQIGACLILGVWIISSTSMGWLMTLKLGGYVKQVFTVALTCLFYV